MPDNDQKKSDDDQKTSPFKRISSYLGDKFRSISSSSKKGKSKSSRKHKRTKIEEPLHVGRAEPTVEEPLHVGRTEPTVEEPLHVVRTRPNIEERAREIIRDMGKHEVIRIRKFRREYEGLAELRIGDDTPLHCLAVATQSMILSKAGGQDQNRVYILPPASISDSTWTLVFPGCTIDAKGATSDSNEQNLELMLQTVVKHNIDENQHSALHAGAFAAKDCNVWPTKSVGKVRMPEQDFVKEAIRKQGFENLTTEFGEFIDACYGTDCEFSHLSTQGVVEANGFQFARKDPIKPDHPISFIPDNGGKCHVIMVEEFKNPSFGLGRAILSKYPQHHNVDLDEVNKALRNFYRKNELREMEPHSKTFNVVSQQAMVQSFSHESRVFSISDGAVYLVAHVSKDQILEDWPIDSEPVRHRYKDENGKLISEEVASEKWNQFPQLRVDKSDIATNEEHFMRLRGAVFANEMFRLFPVLKTLCEVYVERGKDAAVQFARDNALAPDHNYVNELYYFRLRMQEIAKRRLIQTAIDLTSNGVVKHAIEFSHVQRIEKSVASADIGFSGDEGMSKVYEVRWEGGDYIVKVFPLNDDGLQNYVSEWFAYNRANEKGLNVMVKMECHGRLNASDRLDNPHSSGSDDTLVGPNLTEAYWKVLEDDSLQNPHNLHTAWNDAHFFMVLEKARGTPADFSNPEHLQLIDDALADLKKAGIQHPDFSESNFLIDRYGDIKVIDFGDAHIVNCRGDWDDTDEE